MNAKEAQGLAAKANMLEAHIIRAANNGQYSVQVTLIDKNFDTDLLVRDGFKVIKNWNGDLIISWEIEKPTKPQLKVVE